jgi:hypothetical protein
MNSKILTVAGLVAALLITGCGSDDDFNSGDRNNYSVSNNNPDPNQPPANNALAPIVTLDAGTFTSTRGAAATPFTPGATVTDADSTTFQGGALTIVAGTGLILTGPPTPDIGAVAGSGTGNITVALSANATPIAVQQYLQAVTLGSTAGTALGNSTANVSVSDGTGQTSPTVTRPINVVDAI